MYSFRDLRKAAMLPIPEREIRVAVLGNCSTQFFSTALQGYARLEGLNVSVYDADYNQIDAQLLTPDSEVYSFRPQLIVLWLSTEKLYEEFLDMVPDRRMGFAEIQIARLKQYWLLAGERGCRVLQPNFTEINDRVLGNFSCKVESTFTYQIRKLNFLLEEAMRDQGSVYPLDFLSVQIRLGSARYHDATLYYSAKMPVSTSALPYLARDAVDVLKALEGKIRKCVVLDLDNTLWGGVVGDEGPDNIEIGELGRGHVFSNLQRWLKQLKENGILLAVCSKNDEDKAKEPFEVNDEMVLKLSDFAVFAADWEDKVSNIQMIQETLNIGMDSLLFVDDSPFERNLVRTKLPQVEVPELPEDPALYLRFLQEGNYFETASFSSEGKERTRQYQEEFERKKSERSYESIDEYLENLEMYGEAAAFEQSRFSRIAQLTQRSNQFNLRTVRYTREEIRQIAGDEDYITLYYTLRDRFGDYGLVGVIILKKKDQTEAFIDTWLMSCRVLKRGMEEFMANQMIKTVKARGFAIVTAEYIPTAKNHMVKDLCAEMGFSEVSENHYRLEVTDYQEKRTYIHLSN